MRPLSEYVIECIIASAPAMIFMFGLVMFASILSTGSLPSGKEANMEALKVICTFWIMLTPASVYALYALFGPEEVTNDPRD